VIRALALAGVALVLAACSAPSASRPVLAPPSRVDEPTLPARPVPPASLRLPAGVAPTGYQLALAIDPEQSEFRGTVEIGLSLSAPTDVIWLHAVALTIESATLTVDGAPAGGAIEVVADEAHARIGLALPRVVPAGAATVRLGYRGTIVDDDPMGLFRQREGGRWYVYSQMEGLFARRVVPCFDEPAFKVPWQVTVEVPAGDVVLANTPERGRRPRPDGSAVVEFEPTPPMASYLLAVAVGRFELVEVGPVGRAAVPVRIVTPAGGSALAADAVRVTPAIVDALERYFDRALPLTKLDLVAVPVFFGAMENLGLITMSASVLLGDPQRPSTIGLRELRNTVAHELAHQWFGDLVTPRWWDDLWLNESFATWMAAKVVRELDPHHDAIATARRAADRAMAADALPSARPLRRPIAGDADVDDSFDAIAYEKGATLLAMFERRLGPARFRDGVRAYLDAHAGGSASADDFVAALAAASEADTAAAFTTFLDHAGTPEVALALDCTGATPAAVATLHAGHGDPPWTLPLCVRFPDNAGRWAERCGWIPPAGGRLELPVCPAWLVGNADGAGYYRVAYAPPLADALRAHLKRVAVAERMAVAADLVAFARAGTVELAGLPPWIDALLAAGDRHDLVAATALAHALGRFADAELAVPWQRWVRARFGGLARKAGLVGKRGETVAATAARRALVQLVGVDGRDPGLGRAAGTRVDAWLAGGGDPGDDRALLLAVATASGDRALYDRLLAAAQASTDREVRADLLDALAGFDGPDATARNRALFVAGTFDPHQAAALVTAGLGSARSDAAAWTELSTHYDAIAGMMTPLDRPLLVEATGARCTPAARAEVATFFSTRPATDARALALALEAIDECVAERARLRVQLAPIL